MGYIMQLLNSLKRFKFDTHKLKYRDHIMTPHFIIRIERRIEREKTTVNIQWIGYSWYLLVDDRDISWQCNSNLYMLCITELFCLIIIVRRRRVQLD